MHGENLKLEGRLIRLVTSCVGTAF